MINGITNALNHKVVTPIAIGAAVGTLLPSVTVIYALGVAGAKIGAVFGRTVGYPAGAAYKCVAFIVNKCAHRNNIIQPRSLHEYSIKSKQLWKQIGGGVGLTLGLFTTPVSVVLTPLTTFIGASFGLQFYYDLLAQNKGMDSCPKMSADDLRIDWYQAIQDN